MLKAVPPQVGTITYPVVLVASTPRLSLLTYDSFCLKVINQPKVSVTGT